MDILIAGNGFVGRKTAEELRKKHVVKTLDRGEEATFQQNVTEEFSLEEEFDLVIHAIGLAPGFHTGEEYRKVHVEGTENLLRGVKSRKIVYLSALGVGEIDHSFFRTKKDAEERIRNSGRDYTILRPSTIYGEGNRLLELMRKSAPTRIFPDIRAETQPIHSDDLVEIISKSTEKFNSETLELGGPETMTVAKLAEKIYREEGYPCFRIPLPQILQKTGLKVLDPLPGPFNSENLKLLGQQNVTESNDARKILEEMKRI